MRVLVTTNFVVSNEVAQTIKSTTFEVLKVYLKHSPATVEVILATTS